METQPPLIKLKKWATRSMQRASAGTLRSTPDSIPLFLQEQPLVSTSEWRYDSFAVERQREFQSGRLGLHQFISWNEIAENTHIRPMQKWGTSSLNALSALIGSAPVIAPTVTPTKIVLPSPTPTLIAPTIAPTIVSTIAPTQASTATPSTSAKTFDDKDAALVYSSGWQSVATTNAYSGSYRETTQNGATVTFPFTGQSFSILYKGGVTFSKFDVYMDGALVVTLDQKLSTTTYQKRWDYPGQLVLGNHILKLVFKVTSSTIYRGSLDAVIVR